MLEISSVFQQKVLSVWKSKRNGGVGKTTTVGSKREGRTITQSSWLRDSDHGSQTAHTSKSYIGLIRTDF